MDHSDRSISYSEIHLGILEAVSRMPERQKLLCLATCSQCVPKQSSHHSDCLDFTTVQIASLGPNCSICDVILKVHCWLFTATMPQPSQVGIDYDGDWVHLQIRFLHGGVPMHQNGNTRYNKTQVQLYSKGTRCSPISRKRDHRTETE